MIATFIYFPIALSSYILGEKGQNYGGSRRGRERRGE